MLVFNSVSDDPRVMREATGLANAGYQVVVIGIGGPQFEWAHGCEVVRIPLPRFILQLKSLRSVHVYAPHECKVSKISIYTFMTKILTDLLNIMYVVWMNLAMARMAIKQRADIYHAHDLDTLLAGYIAKRWTRRKLVYDFHELFIEQFKNGVKTKLWCLFYSSLEKFLVKRADLRVTVCESLAKWMCERYGINGIITVRNAPLYQQTQVCRPTFIKDRLILYHGKYLPDRGLEQLVESARHLKSGKIVLRGNGSLENYLQSLAKDLGVEGRVMFAHPVPLSDLVKAASEADIGVIPYVPFCLNNRFCLPNKLFEYMMAGIAVVGSDLPELRNIILGQKVGGVFNPEDPQDIARAINEILEDEPQLDKMKHNARESARERYNWEVEGKTLLKAYETVTHERV